MCEAADPSQEENIVKMQSDNKHFGNFAEEQAVILKQDGFQTF